MKILAIDTSCDDTCVSVITTGDRRQATGDKKISRQLPVASCQSTFKILSNIVSSQTKIHAKYGGIYPALAKREHQRNLVPILKKSLIGSRLLKPNLKSQISKKQIKNEKIRNLENILKREKPLFDELKKILSRYRKPNVDLIAITVGPGLEPCLWVGINFAKAISLFWNLPLIPVNHIEGHILANWLSKKFQVSPKQNKFATGRASFKFQESFPAVCLVVSGGHTELFLMKNIGKYKLLGETRDDAAGECFDKTARILDLSYPGGPAIAKLATTVKKQKYNIKLPRPMINSKDYDFSFSGLKTAVLYLAKKIGQKKLKNIRRKAEICAEIEQAITDVLILKTLKAAKEFKAKTILLGGGVIANKELRRQIIFNVKCQMSNVKCFIPISKLCTDNAAMVGVAGYFNWCLKKRKDWQKIKAKANLKINGNKL